MNAAKGHTFGEAVVTKEATETETGIKTKTCTVCSATEEEEIPFVPENVPVTDVMCPDDSPVLRMADPDQKVKTFVEADFGAFHISFQRAKRVNELIINGRVYAEYEVLFETAHTLSATVGGHKIEAGYDGKIMTFINVDDKEIAKKTRLI